VLVPRGMEVQVFLAAKSKHDKKRKT
jgi:hypothetical protein